MNIENGPEKDNICLACPKKRVWEATLDILEEISQEAQREGRSALTIKFRCKGMDAPGSKCNHKLQVSGGATNDEDSERISRLLVATLDRPDEQ